MRKLRVYGFGAAIIMGLSFNPLLIAGEPTAGESLLTPRRTDGGSLLSSWFASKDKTADKEKKPAVKAGKDAKAGDSAEASAAMKPNPVEDAAHHRAREQETLLRRLAVCDQLRTVAARKQDDALMRQADELDERVWENYTRRIAHLPVGKASDEPRVLQIDSRPDSGDQISEKPAQAKRTKNRQAGEEKP